MTCGRFWAEMPGRLRDRLSHGGLFGQFVRFGLVGISNTALSYVLYLIFLQLFEGGEIFPEYDYLVSSVLTFCICTVWSFYWNNRFTFKKKEGEQRNLWMAFVRTVISYSLTGLFLHNLLLYALVEWFEISKRIVPLINLIATVPLNFLLNKYWAFTDRGGE